MWNFRVCQIDENKVGIFEVYYGDDGRVVADSEQPVLTAATVEDLRADLELFREAAEKPILTLNLFWPSFEP